MGYRIETQITQYIITNHIVTTAATLRWHPRTIRSQTCRLKTLYHQLGLADNSSQARTASIRHRRILSYRMLYGRIFEVNFKNHLSIYAMVIGILTYQ